MPRLPPLLLLGALLLSGCLHAARPDAAGPSTDAAGPAPDQNPASIKPVAPTTDTLHFLAEPTLSPLPPPDGQDTRTSLADPGVASVKPQHQWAYRAPHAPPLGPVAVTLWVDVEGTVLSDTAPCAWQVTVSVDLDGGRAAISGCAEEPPGPVATGVRSLQATVDLGALSGTRIGSALRIAVLSNLHPAPGATVELLTGSKAHDTQATLPGLKAPME